MATEDEGSGMGSIPDPNSKSNDDSVIAARRERTARLRGTLAKQASAPDPYVPDPYLTAPLPNIDPSASGSTQANNAASTSQTGEFPVIPEAGAAEARENAEELESSQTYTYQETAPPSFEAHNSANNGADSTHQLQPIYAEADAAQQPHTEEAPPAATSALDPAQAAGYTFGIHPDAAPPAVAPPISGSPTTSNDMASTKGKDDQALSALPPAAGQSADPHLQAQAVEVLNNIDQAMGACAMNLSALQKIASEQSETLRGLADSMQNQNMFEMGLNLNNLMETLSAAVEPMKAVGELVPAIDQLVSTLESNQVARSASEADKPSRPTPEQLVTSLADQLSAGLIDPWTFKCAYMAVFPAEHPADLLHRLVDLLGTQRLSGDLFRAAYDAVQVAEPPSSRASEEERTVVKVVQDENLVRELQELKERTAQMQRHNEDINKQKEELQKHKEELQKQKEELQKHNEELAKKAVEQIGAVDDAKLAEMAKFIEELQKRLEQREKEFSELMAGKDQELQEAQELLNSRWEEFNARYDELTETLHKRDELIAEKEAEIARKETENKQLKVQIDEMRDQTKDMVAEMQKQLTAATAKPKEEPKPQTAFFDPAPAGGAPQPSALFDPNPRQPLFQPAQAAPPQPAPQPAPQQVKPQPQVMAPAPVQSQAMAPPQPQPQPQQQQQQPQAPQANSNQAIPRPAPTTAPFLTGGSYGSGVRAQVFEVIVRQALAGAPWKEICAGPMSVNNITPDEVEAEVKRRQALLGKK